MTRLTLRNILNLETCVNPERTPLSRNWGMLSLFIFVIFMNLEPAARLSENQIATPSVLDSGKLTGAGGSSLIPAYPLPTLIIVGYRRLVLPSNLTANNN